MKAARASDQVEATPSAPLGALIAVLVLAFATRVAAVLWLSDTVPYSDYFYYHDAGRMTANDWSLWFSRAKILQFAKLSWWPPGYPWFLASFYELFGDNHRVIVFVQALLGTAVCALVYAIGRRACGWRIGLGAALLVALNPTWIFMTNLLASENLFVFWLAVGLWLAGRPWTQSRGYAAAGVALALATLTRAVGIVVPIVVALWLRRHLLDRHAGNRAALYVLAACALVITPWSVRNAIVVGSPALVSHGGGLNFYFGHNDTFIGFRAVSETPMRGLRTPGEVDRMGFSLALQHLQRAPLGFFTRGAHKVAALFESPRYALQANNAIQLPGGWQGDPELTQQVEAIRARQRVKAGYLNGVLKHIAALHTYVLLAGFLVALALWKRQRGEMRLFAILALAWVGIHVVFWAQPRFRYPMELFTALLTAWVIGLGLERVRRARG